MKSDGYSDISRDPSSSEKNQGGNAEASLDKCFAKERKNVPQSVVQNKESEPKETEHDDIGPFLINSVWIACIGAFLFGYHRYWKTLQLYLKVAKCVQRIIIGS